VSVVIGAVFASGILATGAKETASYAYDRAPPAIVEKVRRIEGVCRAHGVTLQAAALQFPLFHPVVAAIIPGAYRPENIADNLAAFRSPIPAAFWSDLIAEGLIRSDAPVARS
jgi:D-threo-aldose 1-dehydrogenase